MTRLYVVAGSKTEHNNFWHDCVEKSRYSKYRLFHYVDNVHVLYGQENPDGVFIGTWYTRPDIHDIIQCLYTSFRLASDSPSDIASYVRKKSALGDVATRLKKYKETGL